MLDARRNLVVGVVTTSLDYGSVRGDAAPTSASWRWRWNRFTMQAGSTALGRDLGQMGADGAKRLMRLEKDNARFCRGEDG